MVAYGETMAIPWRVHGGPWWVHGGFMESLTWFHGQFIMVHGGSIDSP